MTTRMKSIIQRVAETAGDGGNFDDFTVRDIVLFFSPKHITWLQSGPVADHGRAMDMAVVHYTELCGEAPED